MSGYDRWLEAPYTDQAEPEECAECGGEGDIPDPDGVFGTIVCPSCGGSGHEDAPTREEIEERKAEQRFDQLRDEGKM